MIRPAPAIPSSIDRRIAIRGGDIFVREWHGTAPALAPLVLLHDSLGSVALWREFPAALAAATGRRVIAYDRLGFGQSSPRIDRPTTRFVDDEATRDFPALADALGLHAYGLFGHSVGGAMALAIAAADPGRCAVVITEAAQAFVESRTLAGIRAAQAGFADPAQFARLTKWHGERAAWVLAAWTEVWLSPAFADWSLDACLGNIRCPVLALHGNTDEFGSAAFPARIVAGVRGPAQQQILDACGHVPHRERAAEVLAAVGSFLARHAVP